MPRLTPCDLQHARKPVAALVTVCCLLLAPPADAGDTTAPAAVAAPADTAPETAPPVTGEIGGGVATTDGGADVGADGAVADAGADSAENAPFDIWEFQVEGNTLLPRTDIERTVYGHLGPGKTIDDVELARQALEGLYRERGYGTIFVDIPEQDVVGGVVRIQVTEGRVERLRVTGSHYFSLGRIKSKVPALATGQVPYLPEVQRQLAALNQVTPDRQVTPALRAGKTPGTLEVDLKVKDELPLHGSVELNDRYSRNTERLRLNASIRYDNLWQREHSAAFSYQVAPQNRDQVEVYSGTYVARLDQSNTALAFYGVRSNSDIAALNTLGVIGRGTILGLRLTRPLPAPADGRYFHALTLGTDYKDFSEDIGLTGGVGGLSSPIDYLMFSAQYSGTLLGSGRSTRYELGLYAAPRGLGNTEAEFGGKIVSVDPVTGALLFDIGKRFGSQPNFLYARGTVEHTVTLPLAAIVGRASGQVANSPLISNEQFGAGGAGSVRGYYESEVLGDDGLYGGLEIRSPDLFRKYWDRIDRAYLYAFTDGAWIGVQQSLPGQEDQFRIWSAGAGMHVRLFDHLLASGTWAWPLRDANPGDATATQAGDWRWHFSLGYQF